MGTPSRSSSWSQQRTNTKLWLETFPEPKRNIFGVGDETAEPLRLNPFVPSIGFPIQAHIDYICQLFQAAFSMYGPQPYLLATAIHQAYTRVGWDLTKGVYTGKGQPRYPRMAELIVEIEDVVRTTGYKGELLANSTGSPGRAPAAVDRGPCEGPGV